MRFFKDQSPILRAIWGALLLAVFAALAFGRLQLAFVSLVTLALSMIPLLAASRLSLVLPMPLLLATTLFIFASIFMGEAFDFYERVWWWDIVLHGVSAVGFGLCGFLFVFMLFEGDRFAAPPSAIAFITFCVAVTFGAAWELFEYAMDASFGLNMQKSGLDDTMGDLAIDAAGALVAAISGYFYLLRQRSGPLGALIADFIDKNRRLYRKSKEKLKK